MLRAVPKGENISVPNRPQFAIGAQEQTSRGSSKNTSHRYGLPRLGALGESRERWGTAAAISANGRRRPGT